MKEGAKPEANEMQRLALCVILSNLNTEDIF